jgi:Holliday junction resolvase-like predicted endonuclease
MSKPFEDYYAKLAGERAAVSWLEDKGFTILKWDTRSPGSTDIEAESGKHLLVQVRTAVQPEDPPSLTSEEEDDIKSRAADKEAEAWEARVQLDSNLHLLGKIKWRKLFPSEASQA